jgi:YhcH/YjgK/YiaL family protein
MILDRLENADLYAKLHPAFAKAFAFLRSDKVTSLEPGRHELDGDRLFVLLATTPGRGHAGAKLEAHRKYIDIQYVVRGTDEIGWRPTKQCLEVESAYNDERDVAFWHDAPESWSTLVAGSFVILYPHDAHAPLGGAGDVSKAVIKVAVE